MADVAALQNAYESIYQAVNPSVVTIQISSQVTTGTGRSRGNYRRFKLCRIKLRELGSFGMIPGLIKASW